MSSDNQQAQKDHARAMSLKNGSGHGFNEDRYRAVNQNNDRELDANDNAYNKGTLSSEQWKAAGKKIDQKNAEYISDMSQKEKDAYSGRLKRSFQK